MAKKRKHELDKFYTKDTTVDICLSCVDIGEYDCVVEPSAGNGSFSNKIDRCLAFDISPESEGIIEQDYLKFNPIDYMERLSGKVLVIGNPPFGNQSSLIFKFFEVSARYASSIAFVLPKSFRKTSFQDRLPLEFHMVQEIDLPEYSFVLDGRDYDVPCIFQVWEKRVELRKKSVRQISKGFTFVKRGDSPDLCIRRVGVNAGRLFMDCERSEASHLFIRTDDVTGFVNKWDGIEWVHENTAGCRSISKQEIIRRMENGRE